MSEKDTGGPAFPKINYIGNEQVFGPDGMTLRQYAAIKLQVPDSGTDWLDEMIVASKRNEFAAKAMQATISNPHTMREIASRFPPEMDMLEGISGYAYLFAEKMLKARNDKD